jgi:hypothetical protein
VAVVVVVVEGGRDVRVGDGRIVVVVGADVAVVGEFESVVVVVEADDVVVVGEDVVVGPEAPVPVVVLEDVQDPVANELPASCPLKESPDAAALVSPAVHCNWVMALPWASPTKFQEPQYALFAKLLFWWLLMLFGTVYPA